MALALLREFTVSEIANGLVPGVVVGVNAVAILLFFCETQYVRRHITKTELENSAADEALKEGMPKETTEDRAQGNPTEEVAP